MKRLIVSSLVVATALVGLTAVASARPGQRRSHYRSTRSYRAPRATRRSYRAPRHYRVRRQYRARPYYRARAYRRHRVYRRHYRPVYRRHYRTPAYVYYDQFGRRVVVW